MIYAWRSRPKHWELFIGQHKYQCVIIHCVNEVQYLYYSYVTSTSYKQINPVHIFNIPCTTYMSDSYVVTFLLFFFKKEVKIWDWFDGVDVSTNQPPPPDVYTSSGHRLPKREQIHMDILELRDWQTSRVKLSWIKRNMASLNSLLEWEIREQN